MRFRERRAVLELTMRDVATLMVLVNAHVKPEQYRQGSDVRELIEQVRQMSVENSPYTHVRVVFDGGELVW